MNKKIFLGTFLAFSFLIPIFVMAGGTGCPTEGLVPCGGADCPCAFCDFFVMFQNIINLVVFAIVPLLAVLMIGIGGFMYIISYVNPSEGGSGMLNKAKSLFKAVVVGLFIIYGAWLIVNLFFSVIGISETNNFKGLPRNWWKINCESSGSGPSGPTIPAGGGASGLSSSRPTIVTERNVAGNFVSQLEFLNTSGEERQYAAFLYDAKGELVTSYPPSGEWVKVGAGEKRTFDLSPNVFGSNLDKMLTAGDSYKIDLKSYPTGQPAQSSSIEMTRDIPKTLQGLPN